MNIYQIQLSRTQKTPEPLPFFASYEDQTFSANQLYLEKNGKPWLPIMGEFHYSRFNSSQWDTELAKMYSGGVDIVASYVIWIHHEEVQGKWDFTGQRNLRNFIELCQQQNMYFFLRVGPWVHAEVRNGGLPDWLQNSDIELRSNHPEYLKHVENYFKKIYEEVKGLFYKDGGPIIGIQIENEYGHAGGFRGKKGHEHMAILKKMLVDIGFDVPFYTATAWGGGMIVDQEMLPVFGGYVDAPWSNSLRELPANQNFVFSPNLNDPLIASDFNEAQNYLEDEQIDFSMYPYLTAELGGGLQVTKKRRPFVRAKDTEAMAIVKLGSGANLLGYYMYHGGTNPDGRKSNLQESTATGSHTDVPIKSYDFQAPLREFGFFHESYGALRKWHSFIHNFNDILARSVVQPTKHFNIKAEDTQTLRYSCRYDPEAESGFIFINNHQRLAEMERKKVKFEVEIKGEVLKFPEVTIEREGIMVLPFQIRKGAYYLESANASLLAIIDDVWVFMHNRPTEVTLNFVGTPPRCIILTEDEANQSLIYGDKLYYSKANIWVQNQMLHIQSQETEVVVENLINNQKQSFLFEPSSVQVDFSSGKPLENIQSYTIEIDKKITDMTEDIILEIGYVGDKAELHDTSGKLLLDNFQIGEDWKVSLRTLQYPTKLKLLVFPTDFGTYTEFEKENVCGVQSIHAVPLYQKKYGLQK